ncbi:MAG: hypothetical protein M3Y51_02735 [Actinomycetota bacterium]|nr:hypothetical protein [Actinomycetota bacterium]
MTIGLLLCDHLDPDVVEQVGDYTELFPAAFGPAGVDLRIYDVTAGEFPASLDECDGWIISGSRRSAYEDEGWIHELSALIVRLVSEQRPTAGICFGHQLIAQSLGGLVELADVGWGVGGKRFDLVEHPEWIDPERDDFTLLMSHRDQVTRLPEGAELVATSAYCPVGAYRIGEHVFCVQGHPEFVPQLSSILMRKRREIIGDEVVDAGLMSLEGPLDQDRVVDWIADFFGV